MLKTYVVGAFLWASRVPQLLSLTCRGLGREGAGGRVRDRDRVCFRTYHVREHILLGARALLASSRRHAVRGAGVARRVSRATA